MTTRRRHPKRTPKTTQEAILSATITMVTERRTKGIEGAVRSMLADLGLDLNEEGLRDTPRRFASYLQEFNQSFDAEAIIGTGFARPGNHAGMITQDNIPFRMICEHHLLPAIGRAAVGYIPDDRVVGLSKLPRLVRAVGLEKPGLQEGICDRIADLFHRYIKPKGVIIVISAEHTCMAARGIAAPGVMTTTSSVRGLLRDVPAARSEFFSLVKIGV